MAAQTPELFYTTLSAAFTGLIWIPIVVNRLLEIGVWKALQNPEPDAHPRAAWAFRLANAHRNALENLAVFAPLAIIVSLLELGTPLTATASAAYFYARVAHALIYGLGVPLLRTIAFLVGFGAQAVLALRILNLL